VGDVNRDGNLDLVVDNTISGNFSILLGDGLGSFAPKQEYGVPTGGGYGVANAVTIADLNGDGAIDVLETITQNNTSSIALFQNNGNGTFSYQNQLNFNPDLPLVTLADVNGDAKLDIIAVETETSTVKVFLNNGSAYFDSPVLDAASSDHYSMGAPTYKVSFGDLNNDGALDMIAIEDINQSSQVTVRLSDLKGGFGAIQTYALRQFWNARDLILGDVNQDGFLDVVVSQPYNNIASILLNDGSGGLTSQYFFSTEQNPRLTTYNVHPFSLGDINADGRLDIVTTNN
jgi:hypothetical protein